MNHEFTEKAHSTASCSCVAGRLGWIHVHRQGSIIKQQGSGDIARPQAGK